MTITWEQLIGRALERPEATPAFMSELIAILAPRLAQGNAAAEALWKGLFAAPVHKWRIRLAQALVASGRPATLSEGQWRELLAQPIFVVPDGANDNLFFDAMQLAATRINSVEWPPGSERGSDIEPMLGLSGTSPGNHWCMAFVCWAVARAADMRDIDSPLVPTGKCVKQLAHARRQQANNPSGPLGFVEKAAAQAKPSLVPPGSIFIHDHGDGTGHTGFVLSIAPGGRMDTIEGNANPFGLPRVGLGVYRCTHRTLDDKALAGFIVVR